MKNFYRMKNSYYFNYDDNRYFYELAYTKFVLTKSSGNWVKLKINI